jgi:hypothetical protein
MEASMSGPDPQLRRPRILVIGTGRDEAPQELRSLARRVGAKLAEHGFHLLVGSWPGVDRWTREGFDAWRPRAHPDGCRVLTDGDYLEQAHHLADGALILGGEGGSAELADRLRVADRPVLPVAASQGDALKDFLQTLDANRGREVARGLSTDQWLRLALPAPIVVEELPWLLGSALCANAGPDVFISYLHRDVPDFAGRLADILRVSLGERRVFFDRTGLPPGDRWDGRIKMALRRTKVVVPVIGPNWTADPGSDGQQSWVGREIEAAFAVDAYGLPVLVRRDLVPPASLPPSVKPLLAKQFASFDEPGRDWFEFSTSFAQAVRDLLCTRSSAPLFDADPQHWWHRMPPLD